MATGEQYLTIKEVSLRVRLHPATIRRRIKAGRFPSPAIAGGATRFRLTDVEDYLKAGDAWLPDGTPCALAVVAPLSRRGPGRPRKAA